MNIHAVALGLVYGDLAIHVLNEVIRLSAFLRHPGRCGLHQLVHHVTVEVQLCGNLVGAWGVTLHFFFI